MLSEKRLDEILFGTVSVPENLGTIKINVKFLFCPH